MNIANINKRNTREWVKVNEDSRSHLYRDDFVAKHGGKFIYRGKRQGWFWVEKVDGPPVPKVNWVFIHPDGKEEIVENLSKFCRKHSLNKAAMYEVYNGKRNHHKKFKLKKQGD